MIVVGVGIGVGVGGLVWSGGLVLRVADTLRLFDQRPGLALRALRFFWVFPSLTLLGPGNFFRNLTSLDRGYSVDLEWSLPAVDL